MKIKNKTSPNTDPCGTPEIFLSSQTFDHLMLLFVYDYEDNLKVSK